MYTEGNGVRRLPWVLPHWWGRCEPSKLFPGRNGCLGCALPLAASTGGLSHSGMYDHLSFCYFGFTGIQGSVKY